MEHVDHRLCFNGLQTCHAKFYVGVLIHKGPPEALRKDFAYTMCDKTENGSQTNVICCKNNMWL